MTRRCSICHNPDPTYYLRCTRPGCTDGRSLVDIDFTKPEERVVAHCCDPDDDAIDELRRKIAAGHRFWRGVRNGMWALLILGGVFLLSGCSALPTAAPAPLTGHSCPTCVGPYDLLLSSHREGLGLAE